MNNVYDYLLNDELFFKQAELKNENKELFVNDLNEYFEKPVDNGTWRYYHYKNNQLPHQGWKIHISSNIKNIEKTLEIVYKILAKQGVSFKVLKSKNVYLSSNSKNANRSSSGKYITIYPKNDNEFLELIYILEDALKYMEKGPYILNDKRWKNTNIFYRYGAFSKMINEKGEMCILNPQGELIIDRRDPFYSTPYFVKEFDEYLNSINIQEKELRTKLDDYQIDEALSFSNSGGIYKAIRKEDSKKVIIKEARPNTGFDGQRRTALERLNIEYDALCKLKDIEGIVNTVEKFQAWEHHFIVEEYIEGNTLHSWIAKNFPFLTYEKADEYKKKGYRIIKKLICIVENMHEKSIVMGDLQPNNIIIGENEEVHLIDFETASSVTEDPLVGLAVPTFSNVDIKSNRERDWYALYKVFNYILLPIQTTKETGKYLDCIYRNWINDHYDEYILSLREKIEKNFSFSVLPKEKDTIQNYNELDVIEKLQKGIRKNIRNNKYLSFNDVRQYDDESGYIDILSGSSGVLWSLKQTQDYNSLDIYRGWIDEHILSENFNTLTKIGLFDGLTGIAIVLYEYGYTDLSLNLFNKINYKNLSDISLSSGLSGIAIGFLSLYKETKEEIYLSKCKDIADLIIKQYKFNIEKEIVFSKGLMQGLSGVSLYFSLLYKITEDKKYLNYSKEFLERDLDNLVDVKGTLQLLDDDSNNPRFLPYLSDGSIGIAVAIKHLQKVLNDDLYYKNYLEKIIRLSNIKMTIDGGFFHGAAGFLLIPCLVEDSNYRKIVKKDVMQLLNLFLAVKEDYLLFPSDLNYRFCFDYFTGSSGVLSAIDCLVKNNLYAWIPCINNKDLFD